MQRTSIQWTEFTNNPFRARAVGSTLTKGGYDSGVGHYCEKIGPDCKNCYSSDMQPRFGLPVFQEQRGGAIETFIDGDKLAAVIRRKKPAKIFWCDMTDMFGEWIPNEWIAACFGVMAATPQHTHQVLTKRAARLPEWFAWVEERQDAGSGRWNTAAEVCRSYALDVHPWRAPDGSMPPGPGRELLGYDRRWPLPNVHVGVSVGNQETADQRIPRLLEPLVKAAVRWVSYEPAIGPVDFDRIDATKAGWRSVNGFPEPTAISAFGEWQEAPMRARLQNGIDWVVCGGESGDKARPFELAWARSVRDQCAAADVPFFMKQLGACARVVPGAQHQGARTKMHVVGLRETFAYRFKDSHGGDPSEWPEDLRVRQWPAEVR